MRKARFEYRKGADGKWNWALIARNGEWVAQSADRYANKSNAKRAARRLSGIVAEAKP